MRTLRGPAVKPSDVRRYLAEEHGMKIARVEKSYKRAGDKVLYGIRDGQEVYVFLNETLKDVRAWLSKQSKAPDASKGSEQ